MTYVTRTNANKTGKKVYVTKSEGYVENPMIAAAIRDLLMGYIQTDISYWCAQIQKFSVKRGGFASAINAKETLNQYIALREALNASTDEQIVYYYNYCVDYNNHQWFFPAELAA